MSGYRRRQLDLRPWGRQCHMWPIRIARIDGMVFHCWRGRRGGVGPGSMLVSLLKCEIFRMGSPWGWEEPGCAPSLGSRCRYSRSGRPSRGVPPVVGTNSIRQMMLVSVFSFRYCHVIPRSIPLFVSRGGIAESLHRTSYRNSLPFLISSHFAPRLDRCCRTHCLYA